MTPFPSAYNSQFEVTMRRLLRNNGLTIVLTALFLAFWVGQSVAGHRQYNEEQREHGQTTLAFGAYLKSAHF